MPISNIVDLAEEDSKKISKYLQEKYKPNEMVSKSALVVKFRLAHNRASLIFKILENMGYGYGHTYIIVRKL